MAEGEFAEIQKWIESTRDVPASQLNVFSRSTLDRVLTPLDEIDVAQCGCTKDWQGLAELLGCDYEKVTYLRTKSSPVQHLLDIYKGRPGASIEGLLRLLLQMERFDLLEDPRFRAGIGRDVARYRENLNNQGAPIQVPHVASSGDHASQVHAEHSTQNIDFSSNHNVSVHQMQQNQPHNPHHPQQYQGQQNPGPQSVQQQPIQQFPQMQPSQQHFQQHLHLPLLQPLQHPFISGLQPQSMQQMHLQQQHLQQLAMLQQLQQQGMTYPPAIMTQMFQQGFPNMQYPLVMPQAQMTPAPFVGYNPTQNTLPMMFMQQSGQIPPFSPQPPSMDTSQLSPPPPYIHQNNLNLPSTTNTTHSQPNFSEHLRPPNVAIQASPEMEKSNGISMNNSAGASSNSSNWSLPHTSSPTPSSSYLPDSRTPSTNQAHMFSMPYQPGTTSSTQTQNAVQVENARSDDLEFVSGSYPFPCPTEAHRPLAPSCSDNCTLSSIGYPSQPDEIHQVDELKNITTKEIIYDAFVSYAEEDWWFVEIMLKMLERVDNSLTLCIDVRDILGGGSRNTVTAELIENRCRRMVVILSPAFMRSPICDFHVKFGNCLSPGAKDKKIIPLQIRECGDQHHALLRHIYPLRFDKRSMPWFWRNVEQTITSPVQMLSDAERFQLKAVTSDVATIAPSKSLENEKLGETKKARLAVQEQRRSSLRSSTGSPSVPRIMTPEEVSSFRSSTSPSVPRIMTQEDVSSSNSFLAINASCLSNARNMPCMMTQENMEYDSAGFCIPQYSSVCSDTKEDPSFTLTVGTGDTEGFSDAKQEPSSVTCVEGEMSFKGSQDSIASQSSLNSSGQKKKGLSKMIKGVKNIFKRSAAGLGKDNEDSEVDQDDIEMEMDQDSKGREEEDTCKENNDFDEHINVHDTGEIEIGLDVARESVEVAMDEYTV